MAKLTKQEVNALASKAVREIQKKMQVKETKMLAEYEPSAVYKKTAELLENIMHRNKQMKVLSEEKSKMLDECRSESYKLYGKNMWIDYDVQNYSTIDNILNGIKRAELKVEGCPSVDEIKDEIVIASIDDDFDAASCIESIVSKFI